MFSNLSYKVQKRIIIVAFLIIPLLLLAVFSYFPALNLFYYSLTKWDGISKTKEFVGLRNYVDLFSKQENFIVFKNSLYYLGGSVIQIGLALYFSSILSYKVRFKSFFKGVLFFPYLLNGVAVSFMFMLFFRPEGTMDSLITAIGLGAYTQKWLGNPGIINFSLVAVSIWRFFGYNFILFSGAIQSVPAEMYEATEIDGANRFQQFWYVTLPFIKRVIELNVILSISGSISAFEVPYIMTGGSNGSMTFVIRTVESAFKWRKYGLASAMGIVLLIIVVLTTLLQKKLFGDNKEVDA
ncbi:carbohydrate ABC transporter permease [Ruminiclostridium cellulolyticum]|uniref:Binding-protein-dependent transport systems inner membrane component n=1 Tax=Ruminiclostridium cellulolyticum (strain ATCC 35319 / DSM 5812 / JCM 6584 / H10) TaxID=394503 RepID=B8I8V8_RUMCH|nr:sugar ABC transporter permease [Ruminiclostridium cellulolyticum]ACL77290.1 binding-protein-dependent transport systems inner membrane component [Ruminiclostridium cellulolyticum H10]